MACKVCAHIPGARSKRTRIQREAGYQTRAAESRIIGAYRNAGLDEALRELLEQPDL